ncbi:hypothetical protein RHGRI_011939 [Rhododendron griersonianum]|uniref:Uncharacterized protein n=1 Tax=Rhododendron griersonianum TaxID=479676 RepID=A0AAV6KQ45_9ERIC|nr:hypothetical protein RHGRI_011939 [Rhododendron griersonianum]
MVVMKFPRQLPLPLVSEMKAKFARFGKLDELGTCVFWKSSMCQVNYSLRASKVLFPDGSGESSKPVEEDYRGVVPKLRSGLKKSTNDENGSIDSITKADNAINKKYCQVEARKNESKVLVLPPVTSTFPSKC